MIINNKAITRLIYIQIVFICFMNFITWQIGLPSIIRYIPDVVVVLCCIFTVSNWRISIRHANAKWIFFIIIVYTLINIVSAVFMEVPINLFVWSVRKSYRGIIFSFIALSCMKLNDGTKIVDVLFSLQKFNITIVLVQFIFLGDRQDDIGGMFCGMSGCNAYLNIYLAIISAYSIAMFIEKKIRLKKFIYYLISSVGIAAIAELKVYFIELVVIVVITLLLCRPSKRTVFILFSGFIIMLTGIYLLSIFFPEQLFVFTTIDGFIEYASMKGGGYNISRLNAFSEINDMFFEGNIIKNLFGFGYGNCEMAASLPWVTSDFYLKYGYLNYNWFAHQIIFLQTGYVGIASTILVFLSYILYCFKNIKIIKSEYRSYFIGTITFTSVVIINIWYNNSIFTEMSYLIFLCMSIPIILIKNLKRGCEQDRRKL